MYVGPGQRSAGLNACPGRHLAKPASTEQRKMLKQLCFLKFWKKESTAGSINKLGNPPELGKRPIEPKQQQQQSGRVIL